ncbi:hypothetical protein Dip518_000810 [Parelusimicrobium proximum]|uniref:hypothetical protein n=1 Tax=Parelusimicrobium proximum TaxID=3228953 RepID=UPI003D171933
MKIGIAVASGRLGLEKTKDQILYKWKDIAKYNKQDDAIFFIFKETYNDIKLLSYNIAFEKELTKFRAKFNLPTKYDYFKYVDETYVEEISQPLKEQRAEEEVYLKEIYNKYVVPKWLTFDGFKEIFYTNVAGFRMAEEERISFGQVGKQFAIFINCSSVSCNSIKNFIDANKKLIDSQIARLPDLNKEDASDRDLRVFQLHSQNKSWGKVADIISEEFGSDNGGNSSEDALRNAYKRVKQKVKSQFYLKE